MVIMHKLTLDVDSDGIQGNLVLVRGERGKRDIAVTLRCGKVPIVLEAGQTAAIVGVKPDGGELLNSCVVYTENGIYPNTILYHVTEGTVAAAGTFSVRLAVWDVEGNILYSPEFSITVKDNDALDLAVGARSEFTALIDAAAQAQRAAAEAEQTADEIGGLLEKHTAEADDKYVPRVKHGHSQNEVLVEDSEGEILSVELSYGAEPDSVPRRKKVTGALKVGDPVEDDDAISLGFAKKNFAGGASSEDVFQKTANALIGEKTGEIIAIGDASPIEHELKVNVKRKNLFKTTNYSKNSLSSTTGELSGAGTSNFIVTTDYIPLSAGNFTVSYLKGSKNNDGAHLRYVCFYDEDKKFIRSVWTERKQPYKFTVKENECFIRIDAERAGVDGGVGSSNNPILNADTFYQDYQFQLEYGATATAYTPYIEDLSAVKVNKFGKNILNLTSLVGATTANGGTLTCGEDCGITGSGIPTGVVRWQIISKNVPNSRLPKGKYTLSAHGNFTNMACYFYIYDSNGKSLGNFSVSNSVTNKKFDLGEFPDYDYYVIEIKRANDDVEMSGTMYLQLEPGEIATKYEPFIATVEYPVNADGTIEGKIQISHDITLITDTEGTIIHCKYNRDINKAFAELQQAIISLGGNI